MRVFNRYYSKYDFLLLVGDIALTIVVVGFLRASVFLMGLSHGADWAHWLLQAATITVCVMVAFYYSELYAIDLALSERELQLRLVRGFGFVCLLVAGMVYLVPALEIRQVYLMEVVFVGLGLSAWRFGFLRLLRKSKIHGKVLIVGTQAIGRLVATELCRQKQLGLKVVGFIGAKRDRIVLAYGNPQRVSLPVFPKQTILAVVEKEGINRILVAGAESLVDFPALEPVLLRLKGVPIEECHTFYERLMSKIPIADLQPGWIALSRGFRRTRWTLFAKRVIDMIVSAIGLVLAAPIALLTAIAIRLEGEGPILYRQERAGQNERPFVLYKFRSMSLNAEAETGPIWAAVDDPRVTRVGKVIRKLRIDEIPQMVNVLKGEMSFVGPRPERPFFVNRLKERIPYYPLRFSVKPGITGWAQILHSYADSEDDAMEKLQYDLYYIKNVSVIFDLQIILETFKVILFGRGAQ